MDHCRHVPREARRAEDDLLLSVLSDWISDETVMTYANEIVLTPEIVESVARRFGQKFFLLGG